MMTRNTFRSSLFVSLLGFPRRSPWSSTALVVVATVGAACSSDDVRTTERKVMGAEGGEMSITLASLSVPEGALEEPTELEMASRPGSDLGDLAELPSGTELRSNVLTLKPHGLEFAKPAEVELEHEPAEKEGGLVVIRLEDDADTTWEPVSGAEFGGGLASFSINGFSHYAVVEDVEDVFGEPMNGGDGGTGGSGGSATGGMSSGGAATGGAATGGTGGTTTGGEGGVTTGGTGGMPVTQADLGAYSNGGGYFTGFAEAYTSGGASIDTFSSDGLPFCVTADIPTNDGTAALNMSITFNEAPQGTIKSFMLSPGSTQLEIQTSSPGYSDDIVLQLVDESNLLYFYRITGTDTPTTVNIPWASFKRTGGTPYDPMDPLKRLVVGILDENATSYLDQELCVGALKQK